jgi:hypothetical protein
LRLESVTQDRLRRGTSRIAATDVTDEEAVERRTRNTNAVLTLERAFDLNKSITLRVPVLRRDHVHDPIDETTGAIGPSERWRFTRVGDVQLLGRWQDTRQAPDAGWALIGGLKLPTGARNITNADGLRAERSLQPGSGTTDLVLGAAARRMLSGTDALNMQATWTEALHAKEDFKPGRRIELAAAWSHAYNATISAVLQASIAYKGRDSGQQAEPAHSGSTTVSLSPGGSWAVASRRSLYAFVQLPLYQRVNGIQLVPKTSFAIGYTESF